jgi:outer membrane receptor for ferrienterochelin and colicins
MVINLSIPAKYRHLCLFAAITGLCASPDACAQAAENRVLSQTEPVQKLETVELTASQQDGGRRESTTATIVVSKEEITRYGDATLTTALQRVSGLAIASSVGGESEIRLLGLGNSYTQILINGEPAPQGFYVDSIAPGSIERIEIVRVPTADRRTQSIAGSVNIVLKTVVREGQRDLKASLTDERGVPSVNANVQFSDRSGILSYSFGSNFTLERRVFPGLVEVAHTNSLGDLDLKWSTAQRFSNRTQTLNVVPRLSLTLPNNDSLIWESFFNMRSTNRLTLEDATTTAGSPPNFPIDRDRLLGETLTIRNTLSWVKNLAGHGSVDLKVGVSSLRRTTSVKFDGFSVDNQFIFQRNIGSRLTENGLTISGKYTAPLTPGHALSIGWNREFIRRFESRVEADASPLGLPTNDLFEAYRARLGRTSIFAQDELAITPLISAYAGIRWEALDTASLGNMFAEVQSRSTVWSPIIQMVHKLTEAKKDQIRLGVARTFKAPSMSDLIPRRYIVNNNTATDPNSQGNPSLLPELALGFDAAFEHYSQQGDMFSMGVHARKIDRVVLQILSFSNGAWTTRPVNQGGASTRGVDLDARGRLRTFFPGAPAISYRTNLSLAWSTVNAVPGPHNRLDRQTPITANFGLDYAPERTPLTLGGHFHFQNDRVARLSQTQSARGGVKRTLDLYALWKLYPGAQLRISFADVLAQSRVSSASYFDAFGTQNQVKTTPGNMVFRVAAELKL